VDLLAALFPLDLSGTIFLAGQGPAGRLAAHFGAARARNALPQACPAALCKKIAGLSLLAQLEAVYTLATHECMPRIPPAAPRAERSCVCARSKYHTLMPADCFLIVRGLWGSVNRRRGPLTCRARSWRFLDHLKCEVF
jgi:hypothetical protein